MFKRNSRLYRLYRKLNISKLKRICFSVYYYLFENVGKYYKDYINKKGLKLLKIKFPDKYNKGRFSIKNNPDINDTFSSERINVIPLNEYSKKSEAVSFIRIDVQEFENDVFEGGWDLIERGRPAIIFGHSD